MASNRSSGSAAALLRWPGGSIQYRCRWNGYVGSGTRPGSVAGSAPSTRPW